MERANRLRDLAGIAEERAAERGVTDDNLLDAIRAHTSSVELAMILPGPAPTP